MDSENLLPPPSDPMAVSREMIAEHYQWAEHLLLRHWRGGWWLWQTSHWSEIEHRSVAETVYGFTENAIYLKPNPKTGAMEPAPWRPNRHKVADVLDALAAICFLPETVPQPSWLDGAEAPDGVIVATANGLLHVESRTLMPHTPLFFNQTAVPFDYEADALEPTRWLGFLEDIWPDDPKSIAALQEFFGYVISGRTNLHKILLWVGPTRGGKGASARVLKALVGPDNVAGPTLDSLGYDFGLAPLLGKPLAFVSDARMSGHNRNSVVERLLNISGEDTITVNRKYREQWSGKLPTRFFVISNELPQFGDASHAIVGRFVILQSHQSWLGKEDLGLEDEIHAELPGILNWALDGLEQLTTRGRFTVPPAADEAVIAMEDLASPVSAFIRDRCTVDPLGEVPCSELFDAWKAWSEDNGHKPGTAQVFGRNLRAAVPAVRVIRPRDGESRQRSYRGIARGKSDQQ